MTSPTIDEVQERQTVAGPDDMIDQSVTDAVALRDRGDRLGALAMLRDLAARAPQNHRATLELLVVADVERATAVMDAVEATLHPSLATDPYIRLMLAWHNALVGRTAEALTWLSGVSRGSVAAVPTFHAIWRKVMIKLASASVTYAGPLGSWVAPEQHRMMCFGAAEAMVQQIVNTEPNPEGLFDLLRNSSFEPPLPPNLDFELLARVAAGISPDSPIEHQVVALAFLVAIRTYPRARQLADRLAASSKARSYHKFAKLMTLFANETGDADCREIAQQLVDECTAAGGPIGQQSWHWHSARLNEIEVRALALRRRGSSTAAFSAIGALAPTVTEPLAATGQNHLYVGLFGQVRFGDITLPDITTYLRTQFAGFALRGDQLSLGISTWAESGQREVLADDNAVFIDSLLPTELLLLLRPLRFQHVHDCLHVLPNTVARLMAKSRGTTFVDKTSLQALLGADAGVSIAPDHAFLKDFAADGERAFGPNVQLFNQARMWHRISGHASLVAEAEARTGTPVTHGLLMRTDLIALAGGLSVLLDGQIALSKTNWAFADHDPHAALIEGLGDRFVLVDRAALDRLLDGYKLMRSIIREGTDVDSAYRTRFGAHTLLNTLLFEHDTAVQPVTREVINFDLYRGRHEVAQLRDEIYRDAVDSPEPYIRESLTALLAANP